MAKANGLQCVCEMHQGRPAEEIIKAVEQYQCDLISSSAWRGRRNEVVLKAPMPVIVEIALGKAMAEQPIIFYHKAT